MDFKDKGRYKSLHCSSYWGVSGYKLGYNMDVATRHEK